MLGQGDLLAVHLLSPYEHARIQRIAVMSPVFVQSSLAVPRRQSHRRSGLATLPSVGAVP